MRILRVALALLVVAAGVLIGAPPAFAGNWVVTVLDPVPDRFEPGRAYTIGFWALQHGSHPYSGTFETIGLRLLDEKGTPLVFNATALPEAAHYATAVRVPTAGTWTVYGMRGCSRSDTRPASIAVRDWGEQPIGHTLVTCACESDECAYATAGDRAGARGGRG